MCRARCNGADRAEPSSYDICSVQGCVGIPPFKVGCVYVYDAWDVEIPQAVADMRNQWRQEAKVTRLCVKDEGSRRLFALGPFPSIVAACQVIGVKAIGHENESRQTTHNSEKLFGVCCIKRFAAFQFLSR